jgi:hypothetical protein
MIVFLRNDDLPRRSRLGEHDTAIPDGRFSAKPENLLHMPIQFPHFISGGGAEIFMFGKLHRQFPLSRPVKSRKEQCGSRKQNYP